MLQVFGRGPQVLRVIQVLARRTKSNPILLGQPGVGKTAIAGEATPNFLAKLSPSLQSLCQCCQPSNGCPRCVL